MYVVEIIMILKNYYDFEKLYRKNIFIRYRIKLIFHRYKKILIASSRH